MNRRSANLGEPGGVSPRIPQRRVRGLTPPGSPDSSQSHLERRNR